MNVFSALVSAQRSTAIFAFPDDDRTARLLDGSAPGRRHQRQVTAIFPLLTDNGFLGDDERLTLHYNIRPCSPFGWFSILTVKTDSRSARRW
jgi:hypothetical protein